MWSQCWSAELVVPSWLLLLLVVVSRVALPHKVDEAPSRMDGARAGCWWRWYSLVGGGMGSRQWYWLIRRVIGDSSVGGTGC